MLENSELKKSLDCMHKDQLEKQEKMRGEIAEYQLQLQEAEKKHQALLLDTNKQVTCGVWLLGSWPACVDHDDEAFLALSKFCTNIALCDLRKSPITLTSPSFFPPVTCICPIL